ncbi:hypothetical protein ACFQYP_02310 [Nonomuraea antimicrobica]
MITGEILPGTGIPADTKPGSVVPVPGNSGGKTLTTSGKVYFVTADGRPQWCTGTAMQSQYRNLVATAGHCALDLATNAGLGKSSPPPRADWPTRAGSATASAGWAWPGTSRWVSRSSSSATRPVRTSTVSGRTRGEPRIVPGPHLVRGGPESEGRGVRHRRLPVHR